MILVADLEINALAKAATPGSSAIGVFASQSANVTLRNVVVTADAGRNGAIGAKLVNYTAPQATGGASASTGVLA